MEFHNDKYQIIKILNTRINTLIEVKEKLSDNKHYALKILKEKDKKLYKKEIEVMKILKSKYIMELKDNFYDEKINVIV